MRTLAYKGKRDVLYVLTVHYKAKRDQGIFLLNVAKKISNQNKLLLGGGQLLLFVHYEKRWKQILYMCKVKRTLVKQFF